MKLPSHENPTQEGRIASAPYNFVPLPEIVVPAFKDPDNELPDQDRFHTNRKTGYFEIELQTKAPLYIRGALPVPDFLRSESEQEKQRPFRERAKNKPDFFYTQDSKQPVIPGSSLRGMLRNLLEVVSYGKMEWVTEKQLFFRTMDPTTVGDYYRSRMSEKVEAGFLCRQGNGYFIKKCERVRILRTKLGGKIYVVQKKWETPTWDGKPYQHIPIWIRIDVGSSIVDEFAYEEKAGYREGRLVITGNIQKKKKEFVFLLPERDAEEIAVPEDVLERFHADDQITQWQQKAFPANQPEKNGRVHDGFITRNPGLLGDPVFFLREAGALTFFGRAQMFRLPYEKSPLDFVPPELRMKQTLDLAEALFGHAKGPESGAKPGDKAYAYASRVFVTDARLHEGQSEIALSKNAIVPRILASPKPTAFQHYLVQTNPNHRRTLFHYGSKRHETVIRGHKLYWHHGKEQNASTTSWEETIGEDPKALAALAKDDTQHTQFKPVKPQTKFSFRVYFENLSDAELGALCWILHPLGEAQQEYCHHLGMGKPLGMGSVKLSAKLFLSERNKRYKNLFKGKDWERGEQEAGEDLANRSTLEKLVKPFEEKLLRELQPDRPCAHLFLMQRIGMLLRMMEWPGFPALLPATPENRVLQDRPNTRYMTIRFEDPNLPADRKNEYRERPVLPSPSAFGAPINGASPTAKPPLVSNDSGSHHGEPQHVAPEQTPKSQTRRTASPTPLPSRSTTAQLPPSPEASKEANTMLKAITRQQRAAEAQAQTIYKNNEVEKKASVVQSDDGSLRVLLPKLKDQTFPLKLKKPYSKATAGATLRVQIVADKNNAIIRVEEL